MIVPGAPRIRLTPTESETVPPQSALIAQLDGAHRPNASGMPGDQLGIVHGPPDQCAGGAGDQVRLARDVDCDAPQLRRPAAETAAPWTRRAGERSSKCSIPTTARLTTTRSTGSR